MFLYPDQSHAAAGATLDALAEPGAAEVLVLSRARAEANTALAAARKPPFRLLSDPQGQVATTYGFEALTTAPGSDRALIVLLGRGSRGSSACGAPARWPRRARRRRRRPRWRR